jgi:hypothetical protein
MMSDKALSVPLLTELNWIKWNAVERACLHQLGVWCIFNNEWTKPELSLIEQELNEEGNKIPLTTAQQTLNAQMKLKHGKSLKRFLIAKEKAAGNIFAHLSRLQHVHIKGIEDDPSAMWDTLAAVHVQQVPGM